jgi:hypothetical protein
VTGALAAFAGVVAYRAGLWLWCRARARSLERRAAIAPLYLVVPRPPAKTAGRP